MGLGKNQLFISQDGVTERTILSALPVNLSEVVAKDKSTAVFADEIVVSSEILTDGHDLLLVCRSLRFDSGGIIRTDGIPGMPDYPPNQRIEPPHNPGQAGPDGEDGGNGAPGGNLTVWAFGVSGEFQCSAVGGPGGRPRDGGNGQDGAPGPAGKNGNAGRGSSHPPECIGGNGGTGGRAGLPGFRGRGGDGGVVTVAVVDKKFKVDASKIDVSHGRHGEAGQSGVPGNGGQPGPGGEVSVLIGCYPVGPRVQLQEHGGAALPKTLLLDLNHLQMAAMSLGDVKPLYRDCEYETVRAKAGEPGQRGDLRTLEVQARQVDPVSAAGSLKTDPASEAAIADLFDGTFLELLTLYVEDQYRSAGLQVKPELKEQIQFLLDVCVNDGSPSLIKKEVMARAYAMARKINLSLDFYGYSKERAPLLAFETYSQRIDMSVLNQAKLIEDAFNRYWTEAESADKKRDQIRTVLSTATDRKLALELEFERNTSEAQAQLDQIPILDHKIEAAKDILMQREAELTAAIKSKNNGCDLVTSLTAVATIVAGVSTGGAGFIAAASAGMKLYGDFTAHDDSFQKLWDNRKLLQDDLEELGKGAKTVAESVAAIQSGYNKLTDAQKQDQVPHFTMERESFDKVARDYADLPQAALYKEAGYEYLKCVETRNAAILAYNGLLAQLTEMQAQIFAGARAVASVESTLSAAADPAEPYIKVLMSRIYLDTLSLAASMVHAETKALAYTFGRPTDAPLSALNVATISYAHQKLLIKDWVAAKERYEARRELEPGEVELSLRDQVSPAQWDAFLTDLVLSFTIRFDNPTYGAMWENLPGVRITGMELVLDGAKVAAGQKQIPWRMAQGGLETIYLGNGDPVRFSHRAVMFRGFTSLTGAKPIIRADFSEKNLYAGLSPFATWLLTLSTNAALELDLSSLNAATLRLSGYTIES